MSDEELETEVIEAEQPEVEAEAPDNPGDEGQDSPEPEVPADPWAGYTPDFDEKQQEFIDKKLIGTQVGRRKEAEEKAAELQQRAEAAERERQEMAQRLARYEPQDQPPPVPEIPDRLDFDTDADFHAAIQQRDEAVARRTQWNMEQRQRQEAQQQQQADTERQQREQAQKELEEVHGRVKVYTDRATKLGIREDELKAAGERVRDIGIDPVIAHHLIDDPQGAAITVFLAKNPQELNTLQDMNPLQAAIYIENQLKPRAVNARPKAQPSPDALDTPEGSQVPDTDPLLAGVTFE